MNQISVKFAQTPVKTRHCPYKHYLILFLEGEIPVIKDNDNNDSVIKEIAANNSIVNENAENPGVVNENADNPGTVHKNAYNSDPALSPSIR